jgi:hypothetical protein
MKSCLCLCHENVSQFERKIMLRHGVHHLQSCLSQCKLHIDSTHTECSQFHRDKDNKIAGVLQYTTKGKLYVHASCGVVRIAGNRICANS